MRIKRLELCGFKSFVDPTVLELSPGISAIVGPNGCGKSNLVDALRWVLGEQSPSRLRGGAMEDVIFNGSAHRGPLGMAEVSLLLDNDGEPTEDLPDHLRDVAEILVTRRYFRSGESEYLINRRPCRLKDITELFLGTGVGTRAYAMIEQGKVDQLVNAKPEDVRLFIEEAAGTTRYRSRRLAAERKVERTRENLARVNDILQEIERNIALFRRMARRAEQYRLLQAELRTVELQLARRRFDRLSAELEAIDRSREDLRRRDAETASAIDRLEAERQSARRALDAVEADVERRQEAAYAVRSARERAESRLEMLEREEREANERLARMEAERSQLETRRGELLEDVARRSGELERLRVEHASGEGELSASLESASLEEVEVLRLSEALEQAKTEVVDLLGSEAELRNRVASDERRVAELRARRETLASEIATAERELAGLEERAAEIARQRSELEARSTGTAQELREKTEAVTRWRAEKVELERSTLSTMSSLADAQSRLASAEEMERGYGRYQEGVRAVMQRHAQAPNGVLDLVAEVLEAPPELEKAVAAVLGERLQYVIVRTPEDAREAIAELKAAEAGRSTFVPIEGRRVATVRAEAAGEGFVPLLEQVRVEAEYGALAESLLGDAVLVDDLERGLALYRRNGAARTIVTRDGDVVYPNGVISGGSAAPYEERLLAQRREIRRLREDVERLRAEHTGLETRRERVLSDLAGGEQAVSGLEAAHQELSMARVGIEKDAERARDAIARARNQAVRAKDELEVLDAEIAAVEAEMAQCRRTGAETATRRTEREEERRALGVRVAEHRQALESRVRVATDLKVALAQVREKEERLGEALEQIERQSREIEERIEGLRGETETLRGRGADRGVECESLRVAIEHGREEESAASAALETSRGRAVELRDAIDAAERDLAEGRAALERIRTERTEQDLAHADRRMRRENVETAIAERYQCRVADVELEPADEPALEARFEELQGKVDRLDRSQIGVEAAGELEEAEQRREFLVTQKADLEASIADLQRTIANLNRASRDRFAETFAAVNEKFQETFPKLFRGGRARLVFTDESNLLETGVDIQVQPPGMNLRTLSLLSGGQKALTAVSLIFSLFLCRPSPFCVLDEVDAPLDDANIDRFNQIVHEMGQGSQFLLITHNKRTMEVAETLYGVTMEEPGVSKIVSVRFQRAA